MSRRLWQWLRLPGWPVLPRRLWLMLGGLAFCLVNVRARREVWPHTPAAEAYFLVGAWVLFVAAVPQLLWVGWHWLLGWQGPLVLRYLAKAVFLAGALVGGVLWVVIILIGVYSVLNGQLMPHQSR